MKKALITGITGQDGSYLAEFLLEKGYEVHGIIRRSSSFNTGRIDHLYKDPHLNNVRLFLHFGDMSDGTGLRNILEKSKPDEVYNLAAQSHVRVSFDQPEYTFDITGAGTLRFLEAIRGYQESSKKQVKVYIASSSEMFGKVQEIPQKETTPFYPRSPYGVAKVASYWNARNYREAYNMFICNGILFNHGSPRRGETFIERKITRGATRIKLGLQEKLYLGNLEAVRDIGFAGDYVKAMYLMLQQEVPDDYVIATGVKVSVKDILTKAFGYLELEWSQYVEIDERYFRPTEVDLLLGDATKAKEILKWEPEINIDELIKMMIDSDLELAKKEKILRS